MQLAGSADEESVIAADELVERELVLNRFNRLVSELMRGVIVRNSFQPWEVEILLDFDLCKVERKRRLEILRQYQRAVERQMNAGPGPPMKFSEFLEFRARRRNSTAGNTADSGKAAPVSCLPEVDGTNAA